MAWNEFDGWYNLTKIGENEFRNEGFEGWGFPEFVIYDDNLGVFELGDLVIVSLDDQPFKYKYIGSFGDGLVLESVSVPHSYILIGNSHALYEGTETFSAVLDSIALCFLAGTLIACPGGERPVEELAIGDVVSTADGGTRRVKWIGRQTVMPRFADPLHGRPVRIRANALADGVPSRDLCVSPDHALLVDGSLVQAGALVDGVAVERMSDLPERFVYLHVEVEDHALILAENTPAETFVDNVTRRRFDNWREYEALYGEEELDVVELELPRVRSSRQLPRPIATRLAARAKRLFGGRRRGAAA